MATTTSANDSQGKLVGNAEQDCPNATELRVRKVEIKKNMLVLRGPRVVKDYNHIGGPLPGFQEQSVEVQIDIELDPAQINEESVIGILKKVFLTTEDMPQNKSENKEDKREPILKVRPAPNHTAEADKSQSLEDIGRSEKHVTPPEAVYSPDPEYTSEAKKKKREGTVILWVVIDEDGHPSQTKVASCLGAGLDEAAMETVSHWRFRPAKRDGQPVAVQLNIAVTFHL